MAREVPIIRQYSTAFKMKVVNEIEKGKFSIVKAQKIYDIGGNTTINKWLRLYGKGHLISTIVRIEMKDEKDKYRQLQKEKKALESALAQAQVKILAYESLIDIAKEEYGIDLKKNNGKKQSTVQRKKSRKKC